MPLSDNLYTYDKAMAGWVQTFNVGAWYAYNEGPSDGLSSVPTETLFATADRPFAFEGATDEDYRSLMMRSNLIVSVARVYHAYNPQLRQSVGFPITPTLEGRYVYYSQYPRPYIIQYQIDCRARNRQDANLWAQWIMFEMNPYMVFYIDFGPFWNTMNGANRTAPGKTAVQIQSILRSLVDNSDLESQEKERWTRWTATIEVMNAYMFPVPETDADIPDPFGMLRIYKVVRDVKVDLYVSPHNPPTPDPNIPGVQLASTVRRAVVDPAADLPVESR